MDEFGNSMLPSYGVMPSNPIQAVPVYCPGCLTYSTLSPQDFMPFLMTPQPQPQSPVIQTMPQSSAILQSPVFQMQQAPQEIAIAVQQAAMASQFGNWNWNQEYEWNNVPIPVPEQQYLPYFGESQALVQCATNFDQVPVAAIVEDMNGAMPTFQDSVPMELEGEPEGEREPERPQKAKRSRRRSKAASNACRNDAKRPQGIVNMYSKTVAGKYCPFCFKNGEMQSFVRNHELKDENGKTTCPILRNYKCPACHATGDQAHTLRYCRSEDADKFRTRAKWDKFSGGRNSRGILGVTYDYYKQS